MRPTSSATVTWSSRPADCSIAPMRWRWVPGGPSSTRTCPDVGRTSPSRSSNIVVLPAPLGPSSATISPRCTSRSTPSSAVVEPYRLWTSVIERTVITRSFLGTDDAREPTATAVVPEGTDPDHDHRHPRCRPTGLYDRAVTSATDMRASAGTGLAAALAAGGAVLVSALTGGWQPAPGTAVAWLVAFVAYVVVYALHAELVVPRPVLPERAAAVALLVIGLVVWFLAPELNWMATLFVVTIASWTSLVRRRALVAVVVVQSAAVTVGMALAGADAGPTVALTGAFASFQAFAVAVITMAEREAAANAELAGAHRRLRAAHEELRSAHAELRAATALLTAASRDAERLRIARDLHDGVGHQLTALTLELEIAGHRGTGDGAAHVSRARHLAKD